MITEKEFKAILDDHERRITLLERKEPASKSKEVKSEKLANWYRKGSTTEKILSLGNFFNQPRTVKEMLDKLKEKDYHFKASDITLPLRNIVRNGSLKKTKTLNNGTKLKKWAYVSD
ncbi:hypothetical protein L6303_05425 [archaeon]|nr:hypothetical protein [Nanoarchaeota archaeon]MCG2724159.1 hypothetical protein [archaeon]